MIIASCFVEFTTDPSIPLCCFWPFLLSPNKQPLSNKLQNDFVILTTMIKCRNYPVFYYSHCMYCKICKMNCMSCQPMLSIKPFFLSILHDNFVFFTKVAKIWNFSWVLTQEFWSLLNIDNHTKPYDLQYLANRMKALTNRTEDC